jgi:UDP-glucose 4-epimerase
MAETLLLTGATGYIASHTWVALHEAGYNVIGLDNLCNSSAEVVNRLAKITGTTPHFVEGDVRDRALLDRLFAEHKINGAIHFAALKAVGESVSKPLEYYGNNLEGLITLCSAMQSAGVRQLVFSSSATVYGNPHAMPILENFPLSATNPYGQTKLMGEQILRDLEISDPEWKIAFLRYFNPVGAHESGTIGEDPGGIPNNLMPYVAQVAAGRREKLSVYGGDYPTARWHRGARLYPRLRSGRWPCGSAGLPAQAPARHDRESWHGPWIQCSGSSEGLRTGQRAADTLRNRRAPPGDIASCYADPGLARTLLGWRARHDLDRMCEDSWRWQSMNPVGFAAYAAAQ